MSEKIVAFPGVEAIPENPVSIAEKHNYCSHESVSLDTHQRVVNCLKCGAVLDPFNFLYSNARTLQTAWTNYRSVNHKVDDLHERLSVLEKERKRLSAQVKRLQEKAAPVLDVRGKGSL